MQKSHSYYDIKQISSALCIRDRVNLLILLNRKREKDIKKKTNIKKYSKKCIYVCQHYQLSV